MELNRKRKKKKKPAFVVNSPFREMEWNRKRPSNTIPLQLARVIIILMAIIIRRQSRIHKRLPHHDACNRFEHARALSIPREQLYFLPLMPATRSHNTQTYKFLYQQRKAMQFIIILVVHILLKSVFYVSLRGLFVFAFNSLRSFILIQMHVVVHYVLVSASARRAAELITIRISKTYLELLKITIENSFPIFCHHWSMWPR